MSLKNQLKRGNLQAYSQLYESYHPKVFRFVMNHLGQEEMAISITKSVFKQLWKKRSSIEEVTSIDQFLFDTTKQYVIAGYREKISQQKKSNFILLNALKHHQSGLSEDTVSTLQNALKSLPERRRAIFEMNKIEGKSTSEISTNFSISEHAVQTHILKATKFLREKLADAHDE